MAGSERMVEETARAAVCLCLRPLDAMSIRSPVSAVRYSPKMVCRSRRFRPAVAPPDGLISVMSPAIRRTAQSDLHPLQERAKQSDLMRFQSPIMTGCAWRC